jgi:hypothetical protein
MADEIGQTAKKKKRRAEEEEGLKEGRTWVRDSPTDI